MVSRAERAESLGHRCAKFKRHVEPRQAIVVIQLCTANVVYAVPALFDQIVELVDASLSAIVQLAR